MTNANPNHNHNWMGLTPLTVGGVRAGDFGRAGSVMAGGGRAMSRIAEGDENVEDPRPPSPHPR